MRAMGKYVHRRIQTPKGKLAYRDSMRECIIYVTSGIENLDMIRTKISSVRDDIKFRYPKKFLNSRREEITQANLAVDHAVEIFDAIVARFVTGSSDETPRAYRSLGEVYSDDEGLFP